MIKDTENQDFDNEQRGDFMKIKCEKLTVFRQFDGL